MRFNGTTIPTHRDETYDASEVSRYGSSGSSNIDVESLNVTENGTYIAPDGKAYSPVNVNVDGGGSSDFSTATVTIVSNVGGIVYLPATTDEGGMSGLLCYGLTDAGDYDIVLYKGMCVGSVTVAEQNTVTTTGDIVNNSGILLVTGDCTITIS